MTKKITIPMMVIALAITLILGACAPIPTQPPVKRPPHKPSAEQYLSRAERGIRGGHYNNARGDADAAIKAGARGRQLARAYILRAKANIGTSDYQAATQDFSNAVNADSNYAEAWIRFGEFLITCPDESFRNPISALSYFERAQGLYLTPDQKRWMESTMLSTLFFVMDEQLKAKNYQGLLGTANKTLKHAKLPKHRVPDVMLYKGIALGKLSRYAEAGKVFQEAIELSPEKPGPYREYSLVLVNANNPGRDIYKALDYAKIAVKKSPSEENIRVLNIVWPEYRMDLFNRGKFQDAINTGRQFIASRYISKRNLVVEHNFIAASWGKLEKHEEAVREYTAAISVMEADPGLLSKEESSMIYLNRAISYETTSRWKEADADYQKAIEAKPDNDRAHALRSRLYATCPDKNIKDADVAISLAKRAIELNPTRKNFWFYGNAMRFGMTTKLEEGNIPKAIDIAKTVLTFGSKAFDTQTIAVANYVMGEAWIKKDEFAAGIEYLKKAIEVDPNYWPALNRLSWICATHPDESVRSKLPPEKVAEHANRAVDIVREKRHSLDILAGVLDTKAAAYANWRKTDAYTIQQETVNNMKGAIGFLRKLPGGDADVLKEWSERLKNYESRLKLYEAGKPYREKPNTAKGS